MENSQIDNLLISLNDEIEQKCFKIKERKREETKKRSFFLACFFVLISPFLLLYLGIDLLTVGFLAIIFSVISMIALLPIAMRTMEGM